MKKKSILALCSMILCVVVAFSGCSLPFNLLLNSLGDVTRRTIPFGEMTYQRPDMDAIMERLSQISEEAADADRFRQIINLEWELNELAGEYITMYKLSDLWTYLDTTSTYYEEEHRYLSDYYAPYFNAINDYSRAILDGPFAEEYKEEMGDYYYEIMENQLLLSSKEVEPLQQQRDQLDIDYNSAYSKLSVEVDGVVYTEADIDEVYYNEGYWPYINLMQQLYKQNAAYFTELYGQITSLDKQISRELGFASAPEKYYLEYARDYTPSQAQQLIDAVRQHAAPLSGRITGTDAGDSGLYEEFSLNRSLQNLQLALDNIHPDLASAWQHMQDYDLYSVDAQPQKMSGVAFVTYFSQYDAPFLYSYWDGTFTSIVDISHEFGHYFDSWLHFNSPSNNSLDVAETYSQGLEMLMRDEFDRFSQYGEAQRTQHMADILTNAVVYQAMLEDFQLRVYAMDSFDTEVIARLFNDMRIEYGFGESAFVDENGCDYSWYRVSHLFVAPFYTISYVTSACIALQIWATGQHEGQQAAIDQYMALSNAQQDQHFTSLISEVGLNNPFETATLLSIVGDLAAYFDEGGHLAPLGSNESQADEEPVPEDAAEDTSEEALDDAA